jgi:hypothetical protein
MSGERIREGDQALPSSITVGTGKQGRYSSSWAVSLLIGRYIQHSVDEVVQSLELGLSSSVGHGQSGSKACKDGCKSYSSE